MIINSLSLCVFRRGRADGPSIRWFSGESFVLNGGESKRRWRDSQLDQSPLTTLLISCSNIFHLLIMRNMYLKVSLSPLIGSSAMSWDHFLRLWMCYRYIVVIKDTHWHLFVSEILLHISYISISLFYSEERERFVFSRWIYSLWFQRFVCSIVFSHSHDVRKHYKSSDVFADKTLQYNLMLWYLYIR